jgi:hypothetical protein
MGSETGPKQSKNGLTGDQTGSYCTGTFTLIKVLSSSASSYSLIPQTQRKSFLKDIALFEKLKYHGKALLKRCELSTSTTRT